jgi:hypothetical protein
LLTEPLRQPLTDQARGVSTPPPAAKAAMIRTGRVG